MCIRDRFKVATGSSPVFGRLYIFLADDELSCTGPAGKGDYQLEIRQTVLDALETDRRSVAYELMECGPVSLYAWVAFLSRDAGAVQCSPYTPQE